MQTTPTRPLAVAAAILSLWGTPASAQGFGVTPISSEAPRPTLSVVERSDRHVDDGDARAALSLLEQYLEAVPDDFEARWRAAMAAVALGIEATGTEIENEWFRRGMAHADLALAAQPDHPDALRASVAAKGSLSVQVGVGEATALGSDVWEMANRLLAMDADDAFAHNALGQLHREVAGLSGMARWLGRVFVGGEVLKAGNWDDALMHHGRAIALEPDNIRYRVGLGDALAGHGDIEEAIVQLEAALALPAANPWDEDFHGRARRLLAAARRRADRGG